MRRLLPGPVGEVTAYEAYRPDVPGARLLRVNMVTAADGSVTDRHGRSGGLAGPGDRELFRTLRALADGILVGAGTVRAESYGPHRVREDLARLRRADGRPDPAPVIVVSRTLELDFDAALFTEAQVPTVVLTCHSAPEEGRRCAGRRGEVLIAGDEQVDLAEGLGLVRERLGLSHLLCEGGPTLNRSLFTAGLVDELCLTLSPLLVGRPGPGIARDLPEVAGMELLAVGEQDGELYLRYGLPGR